MGSDDIVARLRREARAWRRNEATRQENMADLMDASAAEIERLRKQINAMKTAMPEWEGLPELRRMFGLR